MSNVERYFVDGRVGCIAVRDRRYTDPTYQGLHADTAGVVAHWQGERKTKTCPTCGHVGFDTWAVTEEHRQAAHELCAKLNAEEKKQEGQRQ